MIPIDQERMGSKSVANCRYKVSKATSPYKRPNNATTKAQRKSVQGKPCVTCGKTTSKQVANHKKPLVKEYYKNAWKRGQACRDCIVER